MTNVIKLRPDQPEVPGRGGNQHETWIEVGDFVKVLLLDCERVWAIVKGLDDNGRLRVEINNAPGEGYVLGQKISVVMRNRDGMLCWVPA